MVWTYQDAQKFGNGKSEMIPRTKTLQLCKNKRRKIVFIGIAVVNQIQYNGIRKLFVKHTFFSFTDSNRIHKIIPKSFMYV